MQSVKGNPKGPKTNIAEQSRARQDDSKERYQSLNEVKIRWAKKEAKSAGETYRGSRVDTYQKCQRKPKVQITCE
jgi:hypothetical protein